MMLKGLISLTEFVLISWIQSIFPPLENAYLVEDEALHKRFLAYVEFEFLEFTDETGSSPSGYRIDNR